MIKLKLTTQSGGTILVYTEGVTLARDGVGTAVHSDGKTIYVR